jgi:hypothetical protein
VSGVIVGALIAACLALSSWILFRQANTDFGHMCEGWPESEEGEQE